MISIASFLKLKTMRLLGLRNKSARKLSPRIRRKQTLVIILDGTLSSLETGYETNAGITYQLLREMGSKVTLFYESGIQWKDLRSTEDIITGKGINRQIKRAYGFLASHYHPGDQIFFLGYSRGAFAVRSLAGIIDHVGLLKKEVATERNVELAYRYYESHKSSNTDALAKFADLNCHSEVQIEMIGGWDTVKALGLSVPFLQGLTDKRHGFHRHGLGKSVKRGFHALAMDEDRRAFKPVLWERSERCEGILEEVWFKGTHADVGGQIGGRNQARPLSNIPLIWMLDKAEEAGMPLPDAWRDRFPTDPDAPSIGTWHGWNKLLLSRRKRQQWKLSGSIIHPSAKTSKKYTKRPRVKGLSETSADQAQAPAQPEQQTQGQPRYLQHQSSNL